MERMGIVEDQRDRGTDVAAWRGHRVFVTGGTGFIGSWLVHALLAEGAFGVGLVRDAEPQSLLFRSGDITRASVVSGCVEDFWTLERALNEYTIDTVFHLAAQPLVEVGQRMPLTTFETNIRGAYNLLEACRMHQAFVQLVGIAYSDKAYVEPATLPYTEEMPLLGRHPYEVSKSCADLLAQAYARTYDLPVVIARCGNVYGGGDLNWSRIVPGTIRSLIQSERPIIRSDGTYVRDYFYVKDAAGAYLSLAERAGDAGVRGEAFNFSLGSPLTVLELVRVIRRLMGRGDLDPEVLGAAQGEIRSQHLSSRKAQAVLGWTPRYRLEEGLTETIQWYREFLVREPTSEIATPARQKAPI